MANKDVSHLIERLEAFEERLGVRLEGLYAAQDTEYGHLKVNGELHPREGNELEDNIQIVVTLYDAAGRVIGVTSEYVDSDSFFGFEVFSVSVRDMGDSVKVRVYPKAR